MIVGQPGSHNQIRTIAKLVQRLQNVPPCAVREVAFTNDNRYSPLPQDGQPLLTGANGMCFAVAVTKDPREADVIFLERADDQDGGPSDNAWLCSEVIFHGSSPNGAPRSREFLPSQPLSGPPAVFY